MVPAQSLWIAGQRGDPIPVGRAHSRRRDGGVVGCRPVFSWRPLAISCNISGRPRLQLEPQSSIANRQKRQHEPHVAQHPHPPIHCEHPAQAPHRRHEPRTAPAGAPPANRNRSTSQLPCSQPQLTNLPQLPRQTLSRLSQTSTRYNAIASPLLQDDALLLSANGRTLRPQAGDVTASVRRATSVTVASPIPSDTVSGSIRGRCPGCDLADSGREAETGEALIRDVLAGCEPGRLRKFT